MTDSRLTLEELKSRPLEEVLKDVADGQMRVAVSLPGGREVVIESRPSLKPLPRLDGSVPDGWKGALYAWE
jgi:hypothetical protein